MYYRANRALIVSISLFAVASIPAAAQLHLPTIGLPQKKIITLKRRLPPLYNAAGKSVAVKMANPNGNPQSEVQLTIEKQLTQADSTIRVGGSSPDLLIDCAVSRYAPPRKSQAVENGQTVVRLNAALSVDFRLTDAISHRVVASDIATSEYSGELSRTMPATKPTVIFGHKIPSNPATTKTTQPQFSSDDELRSFLISDVARKLASHVAITEQPVDIVLATGGTLDGPNKFALNNLWTRDLEQLETLPPQPDPQKDAYRLYNIGVANEALAYQATDPKSALTYLEQASISYGKALDANPGDQSFLQAQTRIKEGLGQYTSINTLGGSGEGHSEASGRGVSAQADEPVKNDDVIDMVKNKVPEADVIDAIQNAPAVDFDLSPKGLVRLTQGGVDSKITQAMRARARTAPAGSK